MSIVPPIEGEGRTSDNYPFYGTLNDRIIITKKLNEKLKELCYQNKLLYLDVYSLLCLPDGSLNHFLADSAVHIDPLHNAIIKSSLISLIA